MEATKTSESNVKVLMSDKSIATYRNRQVAEKAIVQQKIDSLAVPVAIAADEIRELQALENVLLRAVPFESVLTILDKVIDRIAELQKQ